MRRITWFILFGILVLGTISLSAGMGLAFAAPFHAGDGFFFSAQRWTEQLLVEMDLRPAGRAARLIEYAGRRARDTLRLAGTPQEAAAFEELQRSFRSAIQAAAGSQQSEAATLRPALLSMLHSVEQALNQLGRQPGMSRSDLVVFQAWESRVVQLVQQPGFSLSGLSVGQPAAIALAYSLAVTPTAPAPTPTSTIDARMVYFPPGSPGAIHAFYPLTGKHLGLECAACHPGGAYAGTAKVCATCHSSQIPANHYPGDCLLCHTTSAWLPAHFDHASAGAPNCQSCHLRNKPANHYDGQCSACHSTTAWLPAHFDHAAAGAVNCQSCHLKDKPAQHYNGQCSACHSTSSWKPAHFDHAAAGATDCVSCHASNKPANHYNGQCSACHSTTAWKPATFNHAAAGATDCVSCHASNKPANHYSGQCSACHSTSAWKPASFNHAAAGATDCIACHAGNKPANHFAGQCSQCHSTTTWSGATFNHSFPVNHGGANGVCATCHPSGPPGYTCFGCHNQGDMDNKHSGIPNYASRCMDCHAGGKKGGD